MSKTCDKRKKAQHPAGAKNTRLSGGASRLERPFIALLARMFIVPELERSYVA
jgi:hypothetical protein